MTFAEKMILYLIVITAMILPQKIFPQQLKDGKLNLKECIEIAIKNNPKILAAQLGVSESKEKIKEENAGYYPSLNLQADAGKFSTQTNLNKGQNNNYDAGLSLHYNLFQGGKTLESVHAARYNYEAGKYGYISSRQDLVLSVAEAYFKLLQAEHFTGVAEKSLQSAQSHLDFAKARFKNGLASRSDILKAKTEQSNAKLDLITARNSVLIARGKLNNTLGQNVSLNIKIVDDLNNTAIQDTVKNWNRFKALVDEAYEKRPELKKIESQLQMQKSIIRIAKADYYPTVSLDANYNYSGANLSELYNSNFIGFSFSMPLFSGFSRSSKVTQGKLQMNVLEQQVESLRQQISQEVWNAFLAIKEVKERIVTTRVFLKDAGENLNISEGEYKEGIGSMLDILDSETTFVTAEQRYIEALADYKIAQINLRRTVSGNYFEEILK